MRHQDITPGDVLELTPAASKRYGLTGTYQVSLLTTDHGYKTPWVWVKSRRDEGGILPFRSSDLRTPKGRR